MRAILRTTICIWALAFSLESSAATCGQIMANAVTQFTRAFYSQYILDDIMKSAVATRGSRRGDFRAHYNTEQLRPDIAWRFTVVGLNRGQIRQNLGILFDPRDLDPEPISNEVRRNLLAYLNSGAPSYMEERGRMLKEIIEKLLDKEIPGWPDQGIWTFEAQRDVPLYSAGAVWPKWYSHGTIVVVKDQLVIGTIDTYPTPKLNLVIEPR